MTPYTVVGRNREVQFIYSIKKDGVKFVFPKDTYLPVY